MFVSLKKVLVVVCCLCLLQASFSSRLRGAAEEGGATGGGSGPSGPADSSSSGAQGESGGAVNTAALAKLLQGLAKKVEGKEKAMSGPASGLVGAIVHSVRVMGRRHSAKLTIKEIISALQKKKQAKKPKVSLGQVLDAFRLPPRVPKKKKDPKPALVKRIMKVDATIDKLKNMLEGDEKKNAAAEETAEELKSREMLEGLPDLKPEESSLPKPIAVPLPPMSPARA